ncbi:tail completion protein gp17 [Achromobacter marplatensis]
MGVAEVLGPVLGALVVDRAYPVVLPQDLKSWPAIRFSSYAVPASTNCGDSDLDDHRIQVDVYGPDFDEVAALGAKDGPVCGAIESAFESWERISIEQGFEEDGRLYRCLIVYQVAAR